MAHEPATGKHVLIVEDDPDFAALLKSILVNAGYTALAAYNFADAFSLVREVRPDLITLDIRMPGKSGVYFYQELKTNEDFREIPVVVVTALTRNDRDMETVVRSFLETAYMPHPEAYVEKPLDTPHFLRTIQDVLLSSRCKSSRSDSPKCDLHKVSSLAPPFHKEPNDGQ